MKIARALAALGTMLVLVACGDSDTPVTGVFVDSEVSGLGYECGSSTTRKFTNAAGEFTCNAGDDVRFYIGEILLGSVLVTSDTEVVTPAMLTGVDVGEMFSVGIGESMPSPELYSSAGMASLLQSLDEDGDPDNGIQIPEEVHDLFPEPGEWDYLEEDSPAVDALFGEIAPEDIVDEEEAFFHMLAEAEKQMHGLYRGVVNEEEGSFPVHIFMFDNPGGGEVAMSGLQARLLVGDGDLSTSAMPLDIAAQLVQLDDVWLNIVYNVNGITINVYSLEDMMLAEFEPVPDGETGLYDLTTFEPFRIHTIQLSKVVASPDVTLRDVGELLAQTPEGSDVPVDLEEMEGPRLEMSAGTPETQGESGAGFFMWGHSKKTGIEGGFGSETVSGGFDGHLALASLSDTTMVHTGRVVVYWYEFSPGQQEEPMPQEEWADITITTHADGSVELEIDVDGGPTWTFDTLEVDFASVGAEVVPF